MDVSLDFYMRNKGLKSSKRGRQNGAGSGRGRGGQRFSGNRQEGTNNVNNQVGGRIGWNTNQGRGRGKKQFGVNRQITPKKTGNISSRLGIKKSPSQQKQQYKLAMRIAANKQKGGVKKITGNKKQGFKTGTLVSASMGKFDARLKLAQKKIKITDARQKILQKSQPADARITIQNNLAKKGLTTKKKKTPQANKNVVNAAIPKVVVKNTQVLQHLNKNQGVTTKVSDGSLVRTVDCRPPGQRGIPMRTVNNKSAVLSTSINEEQELQLTRTVNQQVRGGVRGRRQGRGANRVQITRAVPQDDLMVNQQVRGGVRGRRQGRGANRVQITQAVPQDDLMVNQQVRGGGRGRRRGRGTNRVQITQAVPQDDLMMDDEEMPLLYRSSPPQKIAMTRTVPNLQRSIAQGSMLITTRGAPPPVRQTPAPVQYMEEEDPYSSSGQLFLGARVQPEAPKTQSTFVRISNDPYRQPVQQKVTPPLRRLAPPPPPPKVKRPSPEVNEMLMNENVVISPLQGYKVLVTNLHPIVTQDDIIELFGAVGPLKRARSIKKGVAEVVFVNRDDAVNAVKKYHNRELDSLPMQLKMVTPIPSIDISTPVFRLPKSATTSEAPKEKFDIDMSVVHKALFKTNVKDPGAPPTKPVTFTVKI